MKKIKKLVALLLVLSLAVLSACSNTAGQSQNAEDTIDSTSDTEG